MAGQLPQHPRSRLRRRPPQGAPPAARRAAVDMAALIADLFNPDEIAAAMNQVELARSAPARPANDVGRAGHGDPQPLPARQRGASCGSAVAASTGDERYAPQRNAVGLGSLLVCDGCDRPLQPSWGADGARLYVFLCGCRRNGVDAALVERLVRDRVEAESALLVTGVAVEELPAVLRGLFAEVRIGRSAEDLQFVWRV